MMLKEKKEKKEKKVQELHPPSPLHTRRLKSQHHEIITTFPNSTSRYEFALGGGVHLPLSLLNAHVTDGRVHGLQ